VLTTRIPLDANHRLRVYWRRWLRSQFPPYVAGAYCTTSVDKRVNLLRIESDVPPDKDGRQKSALCPVDDGLG
jgi:hypothetical protein